MIDGQLAAIQRNRGRADDEINIDRSASSERVRLLNRRAQSTHPAAGRTHSVAGMVYARLPVQVPESVAVMVKLKVPGVVGVPSNSPPDESDNPSGKTPPVTKKL